MKLLKRLRIFFFGHTDSEITAMFKNAERDADKKLKLMVYHGPEYNCDGSIKEASQFDPDKYR